MLDKLREWLDSRRREKRDQGGEIYNLHDSASSVRPYREVSEAMKKNDKK